MIKKWTLFFEQKLSESVLLPALAATLFLGGAGYLSIDYAYLTAVFLLPVILWEIAKGMALTFARRRGTFSQPRSEWALLGGLALTVGTLLMALQSCRNLIPPLSFYLLLLSFLFDAALIRVQAERWRSPRWIYVAAAIRALSAAAITLPSFNLSLFLFDIRLFTIALAFGVHCSTLVLVQQPRFGAQELTNPEPLDPKAPRIYGLLLMLAPCLVALLSFTHHLPESYLLPMVQTVIGGRTLRPGSATAKSEVRLPTVGEAFALTLLFPTLIVLAGVLSRF